MFRMLLLLEEVGVCGLEFVGVRDLYEVVRQQLCVRNHFAHNESNFRISACEYEAPNTVFESVALNEFERPLACRLRQKGDAFRLCERLAC